MIPPGARRLCANPAIVRVPGAAHDVYLLDAPAQTITLTPDALALVEAFAEVRALDEVLPGADDATHAAVDALIAAGLLLWVDGPPRLLAWPASPTLFGAQRWDRTSAGLVVLGCRYDGGTLGSLRRGSAGGPEALRAASARLPLGSAGLYDADHRRRLLARATLWDAGDLRPGPAVPWADLAPALEDALGEVHAAGALCLLLGGDHSLTLPAVRALPVERCGVLHFDAHTDLATPRHRADFTHANVISHVAALPKVEHLVQIGVRGLQPGAPATVTTRYEAHSVARARSLQQVCRPGLPYYVSFDLDVLDPSVAPGTGLPEPDGLGLAEARALVRKLTAGVEVLGADLVELLPSADPSPLTVNSAVQIAAALLDALG